MCSVHWVILFLISVLHPRSSSSKLLLWHQTCELWSYRFADTEHDVRAPGRAAAQKWRTRQKDCGSRGKAGLHPPPGPVTTCCSFPSNNQATKGLPGWVGLQGPLPVILFEFWVLFNPCQAALWKTQHTRDPMQLIKLTRQLCALSETFLRVHFWCCITFLQLHNSPLTVWAAHRLLLSRLNKKRRVTVGECGENWITIHSFPQLNAYNSKKGGKMSVHKVGSSHGDPIIYLE